MKAKKLIKNIDWSELRTQKTTLLEIAREYREDYPETATTVKERLDNIEGLINLIDNIQDYAVDKLGVNEIHVYNFDEEEKRIDN